MVLLRSFAMGESTLWVSHFSPKKMMYNKYNRCVVNQNLDNIFWKLQNIRRRKLECAWQHFGSQSSFWIKVKLDPMVRWRELDKINVHKIYNVHIFNGHGASCLWFMTHYQNKEKWKNNAMPTYKILSFFLK
jgi:hypothetical protein